MPTQKPTIVIAGEPTWADTIIERLGAAYNVVQQQHSTGYMNTLINSLAALVLVDADQQPEAWQRWTTTPKTSPATRRIPVVLISADADIRAQSAAKGADLALSPDELQRGLTRLIQDYARIPDPERMEQLDCECADALPELAMQGVQKFNAGEYYKQHDLFEEQWVHTEGPVRDLYRAVLQVGVAYFQIQRDNYRGALKMLQRSVQWLVILPDVCQGIDVRQLREDSFRVRAELERLGEERFAEFDQSLIKGVTLVDADGGI